MPNGKIEVSTYEFVYKEAGESEISENPEKPAGAIGDANGDGKVNYPDAMRILRASIGLEKLQ